MNSCEVLTEGSVCSKQILKGTTLPSVVTKRSQGAPCSSFSHFRGGERPVGIFPGLPGYVFKTAIQDRCALGVWEWNCGLRAQISVTQT